MKSIMIIAGDKTEKLADFFTERGAFSVDYAYNSLSTNVVQIRDAIINVDKLLYVYQDGINIKADMQVLKESLSNGAFFTVKEMIFVTSDDEESVVAKKYFNAVIESTGFSNYEIKTIAGRLTFAGIYDTVLGISVDANVKNTFKTVYRVERGDKAKKAFVPADDSNLLIEPSDDSNQLELEKRKTNIINTESGIPRKDQNSGTNIETYFNPVLNPMSLDNSIFNKNTIIVSGDRKSGVSVWSAALAVSASKLDKPVMLFDFTDNSDISELLSDNFIEFKSYRMQELLHSFSLYNRINVCAAFNADERSVRMELLRYLFENVALTKYQVIIAIDNSVLKHAIDLLQSKINRVLYCIVPLKADLLLAQPILNQLTENCELVIVLNKNISLMSKSSYVSEDQIKELFPNNKAIIRSINFEDFELDEDVFLSVMGV